MIPKFRVAFKNKILGEVGSIDFVDETVTIPVYDKLDGEYLGDSVYGLNQVTLMQSTGLFDTNGKEIFEGDVVRVDDYENIVVKFGKIEHEENYGDIVIYQGFNLILGGGYPEAVMCKHEVIGNIYENPELVEG
ncbi:YopX family protein [Streptococcus parasuis]|uniref:YopX family protein n=1 Tax=Streptococcus parasuis TaxID=1501662 RepID=UPI0025A54721|nr:YopX family protein [Streptococcus parasuis]WJQ86115.1 YopX family protein [Streptococcus parasuis]